MALPWIKMWLESLDDPKLTRMSLAERGAWWGLLELTGKCGGDGRITSGRSGLSIDEIADALHIKNQSDRQALESMIAKMEERESLLWNGGVLKVVNFEARQRIPPSSRPEAVAERVRRHRADKQRREGNLRDPRAAERLSLVGTRYKVKRTELGRELTTEERLELTQKIDRELDKKYGQDDKGAR